MSILNLQTIRYLNLLDQTSRVQTRTCFIYNNTIFFAVPSYLVSRAIGPNSINIRLLQEKLGKRIKIIRTAKGINDAERFIRDIIAPVTFKSLEINDRIIFLNSGSMQNKASLIGRDKRRLSELSLITRDIFNMDLKIV